MPKLVNEFGSEFDWNSNLQYITSVEMKPLLVNQILFRSGRDALKAIAIKHKGNYQQILLPALCCQSMILPFTMHGYVPVFYRLQDDFSIDIDDLKSKLNEKSMVLFIRYFGAMAISDQDICFLKEICPRLLVIEDRTHDILVQRDKITCIDYTVASVRKWLAIPDAGILQTDLDFCNSFKPERIFAETRKKAFLQKSAYLTNGDKELKLSFLKQFGDAGLWLDQNDTAFGITDESAELLRHFDFQSSYKKRVANVETLKRLLDAAGIRSLTANPGKSTLYYPIWVQEQAKVQSQLAACGIYCPVIWPLPEEAVGVCQVADNTAAHMLALPCDQRYDTEDMEEIAEKVIQVVNNLSV